MVKRRIIYESDDDDVEDSTKRSRTKAPEEPLRVVSDATGTRRSERSGRGSGGRLTQMKQLERMQTEKSKRPSRIDIATQGEEVNPMAPASQGLGERSSRARPASSGRTVAPEAQRQPAHAESSSQPIFYEATPGQQFGFRLPDTGSQIKSHTQAPARAKPSEVHSRPSLNGSGPPSSRVSSLFSHRSFGATSTVATSRAPSVCSSTGERRFNGQRDPSSQHPRTASHPQSSASVTSTFRNSHATTSHVNAPDDTAARRDFEPSFRLEHPEPNAAPFQNPAKLQRTSSFYGLPLSVNRSGHSMSAAPELYETDIQIDEVPPSEDERIAEAALREGEGTSHVYNNEDGLRSSPSSKHRHPAMTRTKRMMQPRHTRKVKPLVTIEDKTATTYRPRRDRAPDVAEGANLGGAASSGDPAPNHSSIPVQPLENVVTIHRRRNRAPRLPTNAQLLATRHESVNRDATGEPANNSDNYDRPADLPVGPVTERAEPWQLQYYDPPTRDVIERAKQFSHCDAASINPFPVRAVFNTKVTEYIEDAIAERKDRGLIVSAGWWPHHASSIMRLLWEDLGSWRSALRKKARTFVTQRYNWDPENQRQRNIEIAKNLMGNGGQFLRDGIDDEGHVNNLAHPALSGLIIDFFYTGPVSVGILFPEVFAAEVPRPTVALAATALKVVLDEVASDQGEVNFRVNTYSPVYTEILGLMSKCDTSDIHHGKTKALRRRWAELGSHGTSNQEQVGEGCGFDVALD